MLRPDSHHSNSFTLLVFVAVTACLLNGPVRSGISAADRQSSRTPNVVFILADDLGWSDTTLFDTTTFYETPNVQRLAARGMTFSRAYSSSPLCSPTRASILTGLSPARHGITSPRCHLPQVQLKPRVGKSAKSNSKSIEPASATRLDTNYDTLAEAFQDAGYATGHFGKWHLGREPYSARQHGFDIDIPHWSGPGPAGSYVAPWRFPDFDHDPDLPDEHIEDRMAKETVAFMQEHKNQPFFLNYWMFSVHAPFDAKRDLIEKYRRKVDLTAPRRCPTYGAMIESMDDAVGTLLDTIDSLGIAEHTIIVFASDNGGNIHSDVEGAPPTSNEPFRGGKASACEGGVRGPCVVIWPGHVENASRSDEVIQSIDFYPTLLEMTGLSPHENQTFDGMSIVPALKGGTLQRDAIFTYFPHSPKVPEWIPPSICVHRGDWKLIRVFHGGENEAHRWKLYNLKIDVGEQHDVSGENPELVAELDRLIEQHLIDTHAVRPIPNPAFDAEKNRHELEGSASSKKKAKTPKPNRAATLSTDSSQFVARQSPQRLLDSRPNIIMVFADDLGYGDLGAFGNLPDVKTPHLDALSENGVLFTDAYVTAPQCSPSRAGVMTGCYQQRFGFDTIPDGPLPLDQSTIAEHLREVGYATGMVGKWHLEPNAVCLKWARAHQPEGIRNNRVQVRRGLSKPYWPQARGFTQFFQGELNPYWANYDLGGKSLNVSGETIHDARFRVDVQTDAALAFIERNAATPFYLYLAPYAPHVPLEASPKYLQQFPGEMPERRRTGLAMINAVDTGVGRIMNLLREKGIADNTLVMFASDNGAPLGAQTGQPMNDALPVDKPGPAWDGSRNDPLMGEKGMVSEGGIRVPMIWSWPAQLPRGKTVNAPVISLDMTASALAVAHIAKETVSRLDGANLIPWLTETTPQIPDRDLYWRFWNQGAIRNDDWKYIVTGDGREFLFDIRNDKEERHNLLASRPEQASVLREKLDAWTQQLQPPGLPTRPLNHQEIGWYEHYFPETVPVLKKASLGN